MLRRHDRLDSQENLAKLLGDHGPLKAEPSCLDELSRAKMAKRQADADADADLRKRQEAV